MLDPQLQDVLNKPVLAHVATTNPDGSPHTTPVYVGVHDGKPVFFNGPQTRKARNLRNDARVALSLTAPDNPFVPVVIRGHVGEWIRGDAAWQIIDALVAKYIDEPYPRDDERMVAVIETEPSATPKPHSHIQRFDHVGITVANLELVTDFFVRLGLRIVGQPMDVEGDFLDTVIGIPNSKTRIAMLQAPAGGTTVELSSFERPEHRPGQPDAMANDLGLRNVAFQVNDLEQTIHQLNDDGYGLVGGVGEFERTWRMAYVRGPEGIIVSLAQRVN